MGRGNGAVVLGDRVERIVVDIADMDPRALLGEPLGDAPSDAGRACGHHDPLTFVTHEFPPFAGTFITRPTWSGLSMPA